MNRFRQWLSRWQEPVVWLPVGLLVLTLFYAMAFGFDGGMPAEPHVVIVDALSRLVVVLTVLFVAWLAGDTYFRMRSDAEEEALEKRIVDERNYAALMVLVLESARWLGLVWLLLWAVLPSS